MSCLAAAISSFLSIVIQQQTKISLIRHVGAQQVMIPKKVDE